MPDIVECRSDSCYAERPKAIFWQGERLPIVDILGRWRTPEAQCFRVATVNGLVFQLNYQQADDTWCVKYDYCLRR